jgi:hypothetical protein
MYAGSLVLTMGGRKLVTRGSKQSNNPPNWVGAMRLNATVSLDARMLFTSKHFHFVDTAASYKIRFGKVKRPLRILVLGTLLSTGAHPMTFQ